MMNKGTVGFIFFVVGAVVGFGAANAFLKQNYEQQVQEEVDSVKAAFRKERKRAEKEPEKTKEPASKAEKKAYGRYVRELGYSQSEGEEESKPHVISPDDFGSMPDYDEVSLTYFSDGTLVDDADHAMSEDEVRQAVGLDSLTHFGEYEEDSVFVRNDRLKIDYEILADQRTYADLLKEKPYLAE